MKRIVIRCGVLAALVALGCAPKSAAPQRQLSERERDSLIGASDLYGATVVRSAMRMSDTVGARARRQDAQYAPGADAVPAADTDH